MEELAELDLKIIEALIKEPRRSYRSLGEDFDVSQQFVARRVSFLIENQILRITVQKDFEAAGAHFPAHVDVYVAHGRKEEVAQALAGLDEVTNCLSQPADPKSLLEQRLAIKSTSSSWRGVIRGTIHVIRSVHKHVLELTHIMED